MLGITGTPGTGKKSVAPIVAKRLRMKCLGLNDLALSYGLVDRKSGAVDTQKLRARLRGDLSGNAVVYGHLHIPRTTWHDGVRHEEVSLGYPREWQARARPPQLPRQILPIRELSSANRG